MRKIVVFMFILCVIACVFDGCRTQKVVERTESRDSFLSERIESIVYVEVPVEFEIPAQKASILTIDSTSHLETDFAVSDAKICWNGGVPYLNHTLANKPKKIQKDIRVPTKHIYVNHYRTVYRTRYRDRVIEKQLTLYQRAMLNIGPWIIIGLLVWLAILRLRKG